MSEKADGSADLEALATANGIATSYFDAMGNERVASAEAMLAALRALGVEIESATDAAGLLETQLRERWSFRAEPVVVAWDGAPSRLMLRARADATGAIE